MGSSIEQSLQLTQQVNNNILNSSKASCTTECKNISQGNTIIISGTTLRSFNFDQSCQLTSVCSINSELDTSVDNILKSLSEQKAGTEKGLLGISLSWNQISNRNQVEQIVTTTISNINETSCQTSSINIFDNNFIFFQNSTVQGDIQFSQTGNVNSNCMLNNISRIQVQNQLASENKQTATIGSGLGLIIAIIILLIAVFLIVKLLGGKGGGGGGNQQNGQRSETESAAIMAAQSGALGPEAKVASAFA